MGICWQSLADAAICASSLIGGLGAAATGPVLFSSLFLNRYLVQIDKERRGFCVCLSPVSPLLRLCRHCRGRQVGIPGAGGGLFCFVVALQTQIHVYRHSPLRLCCQAVCGLRVHSVVGPFVLEGRTALLFTACLAGAAVVGISPEDGFVFLVLVLDPLVGNQNRTA